MLTYLPSALHRRTRPATLRRVRSSRYIHLLLYARAVLKVTVRPPQTTAYIPSYVLPLYAWNRRREPFVHFCLVTAEIICTVTVAGSIQRPLPEVAVMFPSGESF